MKETRIAIYRILRKMGVTRAIITPCADLRNDLNFDGLEMDVFLFWVETRFNTSIANDDAARMNTVGDWIGLLDARS